MNEAIEKAIKEIENDYFANGVSVKEAARRVNIPVRVQAECILVDENCPVLSEAIRKGYLNTRDAVRLLEYTVEERHEHINKSKQIMVKENREKAPRWDKVRNAVMADAGIKLERKPKVGLTKLGKFLSSYEDIAVLEQGLEDGNIVQYEVDGYMYTIARTTSGRLL